MNQPVDAVITWVDGNDPKHEKKLTDQLERLGIKRPPEAARSRYNQSGEIEFCVKSILYFAPWIKNIYIVTDDQTPSIVTQLQHSKYCEKIIMIDHHDIFSEYTNHLPTFNSLSIESLLWRIPGLSEQFIYFNDDVILIKPLQYKSFFANNDRLMLRGNWKISSKHAIYRLYKKMLALGPGYKNNLHRTVQENSANLANFKTCFFHLPHTPFPLKKTFFAEFFQKNPQLLINNIQHPIRHNSQFSPVSLAYHFEIRHPNSVVDRSQQALGIDAKRYSLNKIQKKLEWANQMETIAFLNIQNLDLATYEKQQFIFCWLKNVFKDFI